MEQEKTEVRNPRDEAASRTEDALWAIAQSQSLLQTAMAELCRQKSSERATRTPRDVLTKLDPNDDIETYLQIFEQTAHREKWPTAEWAGIIAPFLTGEAQQAYHHLPASEYSSYGSLKAAILAHYGYSLAARAQRYHQWTYDATLPARPQVMELLRRTRSWLEEGEGPGTLDRIVMDRCTRALPHTAKRYVAHQGPQSIDVLIALLENHKVTAEMMGRGDAERPTKGEEQGREKRPNLPRSTPLQRRREREPSRDTRSCFGCGKQGHLVRDCPGEEVPMESVGTNRDEARACHYLTTCWAHERTKAPRIPVRVAGRDTEATIDSGSAITLVRPELAETARRGEVDVACIHGDTRRYPTTELHLYTPRGQCKVRAGVVENLPVPLLMGRDCPLFQTYWKDGPKETPTRIRPRNRHNRDPSALPVWVATERESEEEGTEATREGPASNRGEPTPGVGTTPDDELTPFSEFPRLENNPECQTPQFGRAQHEEPTFTHAWRNARLTDGGPHQGVSSLTPPFFKIMNALLYRVCVIQGNEVDQLLVPRTHVGKVLYLGHTHLLGAHLGAEKTYERIRRRFYWPGIKKEVEEYCKHCAECQLHSPKSTVHSPLVPLPILDIPFQRIGLDIVGPLPKSSRGHKYILVIVDYATRYPEAVPLRTATGKTIARELFTLFSRVGIAEEILTDQGTCFMSQVLREMCHLLKVAQVRTSVYHPQTDGLVERFNKTLKSMMRKMIADDPEP